MVDSFSFSDIRIFDNCRSIVMRLVVSEDACILKS